MAKDLRGHWDSRAASGGLSCNADSEQTALYGLGQVNEHDTGELVTGKSIIVMDVWEYANMPQYGLDRAKYIERLFPQLCIGVLRKKDLLRQLQNSSTQQNRPFEAGCITSLSNPLVPTYVPPPSRRPRGWLRQK